MKELYYDKFAMQFTTKKEVTAPPERYVQYVSDGGSDNLYEVHFIGTVSNDDGSVNKFLKFTYSSEERLDGTALDKKRDEFFKKNGISDYEVNPHKYYTTEMCIPENHFNDALASVR